MALRLSPAHPLVWRTPTEVQFGVERPVVTLRGLDPRQHFLLGVLQKGVSRPVLAALAGSRGIGASVVDELLASLTPALEHPAPVPAPVAPLDGVTVGVRGHGAPVPAIEALLQQSGARSAVTPAAAAVAAVPPAAWLAPPDIGVLVSHYATAPPRAAAWLREDVPHLLVEFGDRSVRIGPMVVPGLSACAACVEYARAEADPCWPALAAQLSTRQAPTADAVGAAMAAGLVVAAVIEHHSAGASSAWPGSALRVRPAGLLGPGAVSVERVSPHPRCGCRSLPGSGRPPGEHRGGSPPTPTTGAAARAPG